MRLLLVAVGGALGAAARYAVSGWAARLSAHSTFPYGTLTVNVAGSFLLGLLMGAAASGPLLVSPRLRAFLALGFLGAFTTFSTFSYETMAALRVADLRTALANVAVSVAAGLAACWLGLALADRL
jgi:CrcB protein